MKMDLSSRSHSHHPHLEQFKAWWQEKFNTSTLKEVTEALPEVLAYPIGVTITDLQGIGAISLSQAGSIGLAIGWNYPDAINSIMNGVNMLIDDYNYRDTKYIQAILEIISGVQALIFTYCPPITAAAGLSPVALAGPAFTFMMLCDFINSAIDFYYCVKESKFKGWLHERVKEVNYLLKSLSKLQCEFEELEQRNKIESVCRKQLKLKKRMNGIINKRENLLRDILIRSHVYLHKLNCQSETESTFVHRQINSILLTPNDTHMDINANEPPTQAELERDAEIEQELRENFKKHRINLIMKGLSFCGMLILAIAPFTGPAAPFVAIPGLVIVTFVAGYYLYKHREEIKHFVEEVKDHISHLKHSIFHKHNRKETQVEHGLSPNLAACI